MKKYNLAKREGAYQKAPSGPRRGHIARVWIDRGDGGKRIFGSESKKRLLNSELFFFILFFSDSACTSDVHHAALAPGFN